MVVQRGTALGNLVTEAEVLLGRAGAVNYTSPGQDLISQSVMLETSANTPHLGGICPTQVAVFNLAYMPIDPI